MSAAVPRIVASFTYQSQVGDVAPLTLYTPSADGTFRLTMYADAASVAATKLYAFRVGWHDDAASHTVDPGSLSAGTNQYLQWSYTVRCTSSNSIALQVHPNTNDTTDSYNLYIIVEEL